MSQIENDENKNLIDDREEATVGMEEVDNFDFERANMLMSVMEKVANIAPKSSSISGLAAAALEEMNQEAKEIAKRRAEAYKELERKRDEALAAQRKQEEEDRIAAENESLNQPALQPDPSPPPPQRRAVPATQFDAPAPSKTDQIARENARRV